jgi:hypothetical protein
VGLNNETLQHLLIEASRQGGRQQRVGVAMPQGPDVKLGEARERDGRRLACCEHERDLLCEQAAGHEGKRARRRIVEPLRVVDETGERPVLGGLRQQAEDRQPDEQRIRSLPGAESERDGKGVALRVREPLSELQDGCAQLL